MQSLFPPSVENLIDAFARLPGIGRKSAARLAHHILSCPMEEVNLFASALLDARRQVTTCRICHNLTEEAVCPLCRGAGRDTSVICVVAHPRDVAAIERTREYKGVYHVLHGTLSPLQQIGPDDLTLSQLVARVAKEPPHEVILATNPDTEGEATATYVAHLLRPYNIKVTRLAYGIPMGGHLEYADDMTLARALEGRQLF